jgi:O-antigen ligase
VGAAVAVAAAFARTQRLGRDTGVYEVEPLLKASVAIIAVVGVSLPVAMSNDTSFTAWLRDASPYVLFAVAPLLALDAYAGLSTTTLRRLLVAAGLAGTLAFTAEWMTRRGLVSIPDIIGLPTVLLGAALFSYAFAVVLEGNRRRLPWLALAAVVLAGYLSTGSRSTVLLLVAPLAIVLGTRERLGRRSLRLFVVVPAAILLVGLALHTVVRATGADQEALSARAQLLARTGGSADLSVIERRSQSEAAWELFKESPFLGLGPGYPITWLDTEGETVSASAVDSPIAYLTKFGLLGLVPLAFLIWAFVTALERMRRRTHGRTVAQLSLIGFAGVVLAWSFLHVPFEEKGITSALLLLLALALSEEADSSSRPAPGFS